MNTTDDSQPPDWVEAFPVFGTDGDPAMRRIARAAQIISLPEGSTEFGHHNFCLLIEGSLRVRILSGCGNEISLCRVRPGQVCWFNAFTLLGQAGAAVDADVVVESRARLATIHEARFREALDDSPAFRAFVFSTLTAGIAELITLVEEMRFGHMNQRIAQWLLTRAEDEAYIKSTHSTVALELGTAREVVSRLLKDFERAGWVKLHRGRIDVLNRAGLDRLAHNAPPAARTKSGMPTFST
jgi:CRP/FNR family transcriptional regulator